MSDETVKVTKNKVCSFCLGGDRILIQSGKSQIPVYICAECARETVRYCDAEEIADALMRSLGRREKKKEEEANAAKP